MDGVSASECEGELPPTAANLGHQLEPGDLQVTGLWGQLLMQLLGAPE